MRYFDAYSGGIILSTDPAGIAYNGNHLFIVDSEINENGPPPPPGYFLGHNIFETNLDGNILYGEYITVPESSSIEPTGICYNPVDGYFYITNDNTKKLYQYVLNDSFSIRNTWDLAETLFGISNYWVRDPEGITVNPLTGTLYIADGNDGLLGGSKILEIKVKENSITFVDSFSVKDMIIDPEGIAYHENTGHIFIVSAPDNKIFEYDVSGNFIDDYDISEFQPSPRSPQGLTFAPNSKDNSRLSLYIADGGHDESPERARIYEADLGDEISLSVQLFSFKAMNVDKTVKLDWEIVTNHENITWLIEKKNPNSDIFVEIARIEEFAGFDQSRLYEYYDSDVKPGRNYFYRLRDINSMGNATLHQEISITTSAPEYFFLAQNYPNPFNPKTTIEFDLPEEANVKLDLFNTLGQVVRTLTNKPLNAGHYKIEFDSQNIPSGVYFYRFTANSFQDVKRMILIK